MMPLTLDEIRTYLATHIGNFHQKRLDKLQTLRLTEVLKRKNPYLFRAKYLLTAETLIRSILYAYLSSQEETLFGDFLELVAIFVCQKVYNAYKPALSELTGIDLVFEKDKHLYIVEIKSGPYWGNSSQINKMIQNFAIAKEKLKLIKPELEIIAVNGCTYGKDNHTKQADYWKLCGQDFWRFISGNDSLYLEIIEPLAYQSKQRNEIFEEEYAKIVNRFSFQFAKEFCQDDGAIDWNKLVRFVSQRENTYPFDS